jgi:hypothetical protein
LKGFLKIPRPIIRWLSPLDVPRKIPRPPAARTGNRLFLKIPRPKISAVLILIALWRSLARLRERASGAAVAIFFATAVTRG